MRAALLALAVFVVYRPSLGGGFLWDDDQYLTANPHLQSAAGLAKLWFSREPLDYYPLSSSTLWLQWQLWGPDPAPYRAVNLALHLANALLLVSVLSRLRIPGAWLAGALFALHPVCVEAAAWIAQRKTLLALTFALLALGSALDAEKNGRPRDRLLSLAFFAASLLSKTSMVALPLVLPLLAWWRHGRLTRADLVRAVPYALLAAAAGAVTVWYQHTNAVAGADLGLGGPLDRLVLAGWTLSHHLAKAFVPVGLAAVYPRWTIAASNGLQWLPLLAVAALTLAVWFPRDGHNRCPLWTAWAAYVLLLAPVLGFAGIGFMVYAFVADHWQYGALPCVLAPFAAVLATRLQPRLALAVSVALLVAFGQLAHQRAADHASEEALWRANIARFPEVSRGWSGLGEALATRGDATGAREALERAVELDDGNASAHANLGAVLTALGDPENALVHFERAVTLHPGNLAARLNFGLALLGAKRQAEAAHQFELVLATAPNVPRAALGLAWIKAVSADEALRDPARALALLEPYLAASSPLVLDIQAAALAASGRHEEAVQVIARALRDAQAAGQTNNLAPLRQRAARYAAKDVWRE